MEGCAMKLRSLVMAAVLLWPAPIFSQNAQPSIAYFRAGNDLFEDCSAPKHVFCIGYVLGVADTLSELKVVCPPDHATSEQFVAVAMNRFRDHPEMRHYSGASEIYLALKQAFPCVSSR
jgi:hypothetical protein